MRIVLISPQADISGLRSNDGPSGASGFVLPLTLWVIALFGLGVAAMNGWVSVAVENARVLQQKVDAEVAFANVKNEIVFVMGTRPMTHRGLEVGGDLKRPKSSDFMEVMSASFESSDYVAFDGRPYVVESNPDYVVQLQDGRGLVNLNAIIPQFLRRLLALYDVPETLRNQLPDTLQDWVDEDDLARLSGAEKIEYERYRRIPPSNAFLLTPLEAQSILGWDEIPKVWEEDAKSPLFTTCGASGFNPNTASENVMLAYIPGLTKEGVAQVEAYRRKTPFRHGREFMSVAGVIVPNEAFFFGVTPGSCVIVDLINRTTNNRLRFSLSLVPFSLSQPWQVDYAFEVSSRYRGALDRVDPEVTFPAPEAIYSRETGDNGISRIR